MKRRQTYHIAYKMDGSWSSQKSVDVIASNKAEAYDTAFYEAIPAKEGAMPYSAWVVSVTYQNGNSKSFNTFEGNPY